MAIGSMARPSCRGGTPRRLFRVAVRLLEGQQPKLGTLLIPIPAVHQDDLGKW